MFNVFKSTFLLMHYENSQFLSKFAPASYTFINYDKRKKQYCINI